jgi:hypothetical protein
MKILDEQFRSATLIQRQAGGAKVCFYYPKKYKGLLFDNRDIVSHVASVIVAPQSNKEKKMRAKLFLVRGRFFSIEFPKRPEAYMQKRGIDINKDELRVITVESYIKT